MSGDNKKNEKPTPQSQFISAFIFQVYELNTPAAKAWDNCTNKNNKAGIQVNIHLEVEEALELWKDTLLELERLPTDHSAMASAIEMEGIMRQELLKQLQKHYPDVYKTLPDRFKITGFEDLSFPEIKEEKYLPPQSPAELLQDELDIPDHDNIKYILCFRGTNHPHDALKEGISPHGGKIGPIKYQGAIDTDTAIPLSPLLDVAASFPPNREHPDIITIDVVLIPLPEKNENLVKSAIEKITSKVTEFSASERSSNAEFVNASSIQRLDSIFALKTLAEKKENGNDIMEIVYDELSGMIWPHELAVKKIDKANVIASLQCQREIDKFKIIKIQLQDDEIVNKDFAKFSYKLLIDYLKKYTDEFHPIASTLERAAYRGYLTDKRDYTKIHKDVRYQFYLEQIQRYCDKNKIYFTHDDNLELMQSFKEPTFDVKIFCSTLAKNKNAYQPHQLSDKKRQDEKLAAQTTGVTRLARQLDIKSTPAKQKKFTTDVVGRDLQSQFISAFIFQVYELNTPAAKAWDNFTNRNNKSGSQVNIHLEVEEALELWKDTLLELERLPTDHSAMASAIEMEGIMRQELLKQLQKYYPDISKALPDRFKLTGFEDLSLPEIKEEKHSPLAPQPSTFTSSTKRRASLPQNPARNPASFMARSLSMDDIASRRRSADLTSQGKDARTNPPSVGSSSATSDSVEEDKTKEEPDTSSPDPDRI